MAPLRALRWRQGIPRGKALTNSWETFHEDMPVWQGRFVEAKLKKKEKIKKKIGTRKETEGSGKAKFLFTLTEV